jgi:hypothetical protein
MESGVYWVGSAGYGAIILILQWKYGLAEGVCQDYVKKAKAG